MSEITTDLVQQGLTAARVGDTVEARRLLTRATEVSPDNVEAWLGLAGVVDDLIDKKTCFSKVLELAPDHEEAQAGLALIEKKIKVQQADTGVGFCVRHPQTETALRCNKCNDLICPKCAVRTPVGFRCPNCIREQEDKYYSGGNTDYVIAAVVAFPLSFIAATLFTLLLGGFGFFILIIAFFVAPMTGGLIAEAVRWAVGKRRSRYLRHVVIGCLIVATAPFLLLILLGGNFFGLLGPGMLLFLGGGTISARLR